MLSRLEIKLESSKKLSSQMGSLFHGVLMELINSEYADYLHASQLKPFSQNLLYREDGFYWIIQCLDKDSRKYIIHECLLGMNEIEIKKEKVKVSFVSKNYLEIPLTQLSERFYNSDASRYIHLQFYTPTSFKSQGNYLFYPDIKCIYQSLMNKYSAVGDESFMDEEALEELCRCSHITWYDLKSVSYSLEGIKIPAFIGKITLKISGTQTMVNFARMLFEFGEFSGVGIKSALGMGAVRITEKEGKKHE